MHYNYCKAARLCIEQVTDVVCKIKPNKPRFPYINFELLSLWIVQSLVLFIKDGFFLCCLSKTVFPRLSKCYCHNLV